MMRKNRIGILAITAFFVGLIVSGQITSAQFTQKDK